MDLELFRSFHFQQRRKDMKRRKNSSERVADSNHEPLDLKSFHFERSHKELDEFRWSKSLLILQLIFSVNVAHQVQWNYEENTLFMTHTIALWGGHRKAYYFPRPRQIRPPCFPHHIDLGLRPRSKRILRKHSTILTRPWEIMYTDRRSAGQQRSYFHLTTYIL